MALALRAARREALAAGPTAHLSERQRQTIELIERYPVKIKLHPFQPHAELVFKTTANHTRTDQLSENFSLTVKLERGKTEYCVILYSHASR